VKDRRRIDMLQDCLAVLAEGDIDDARAVIAALSAMESYTAFGLRALFRPVEYPAIVRAEIVAQSRLSPEDEVADGE